MPFFEYKCLDCGKEFEELIRCEDDFASLRCPDCQSRNFQKLLSMFGMVTSGGKVVTSGVGGGLSCSGCAKSSCAGCK
jgi:putative FmdB family regulatory protein